MLKTGDRPAWQGSAGPRGAWHSIKLVRWAGLARSCTDFILSAIEGNEELIEGHAPVWLMS